MRTFSNAVASFASTFAAGLPDSVVTATVVRASAATVPPSLARIRGISGSVRRAEATGASHLGIRVASVLTISMMTGFDRTGKGRLSSRTMARASWTAAPFGCGADACPAWLRAVSRKFARPFSAADHR